MKRMTAVLCVAAMLFSFAACSKMEDYNGQSITGQVTEIDGNKITLQLGELKEQDVSRIMENNPDGEQQPEGQDQGQTPPEMPEGEQRPEGQDQGQTPPEMPEEEQQPEGQDQGQTPPEMPEGEQQPEGQDQGQTPPDKPQEDNGNEMPLGVDRKMNSFTAGDASVTFDFDGAVIKVEKGTETTEGTIEDISVDSVLVVEVGDKNTIKTVTVKFIDGMGMSGGFGGTGEAAQGTSADTL